MPSNGYGPAFVRRVLIKRADVARQPSPEIWSETISGELYPIIEACSPGPFLELFARGARPKWESWGNQADSGYCPDWPTYKHHSRALVAAE
jgi:N6-adenosine-specific RNA methylase IME4